MMERDSSVAVDLAQKVKRQYALCVSFSSFILGGPVTSVCL